MKQVCRLNDDFISALADRFGTPFYLFDWQSVLDSRSELRSLVGDLPVRNWLSMKTAPVKPLIKAWHDVGEGIEVVSCFELKAALSVGYQPDQILVNGPGKTAWLGRFEMPGLNVVLDSIQECEQLGALAKGLKWVVGIRITPSNQKDPDDENYSGQFGISPASLKEAANILNRFGVQVTTLHFHLRSNVSNVRDYEAAAMEVIDAAGNAGLYPVVLDCGGGLPVPGEVLRETNQETWSDEFLNFGKILRGVINRKPQIREVWLENGRFLVARSGMLVIRAVDVKPQPHVTYVICDGGRITNAFPSDWERHAIEIIPHRAATASRYCICGPTCMAYDWIERANLNVRIQPGDLIVWQNCGAYHLPWETRFSFGLAPVIWLNGEGAATVARERESFEDWWNVWK